MKLRTVLSVAAALLALSLAPHSAQALTLNSQASAIASLIANTHVDAYCGDNEAEWLALPDVAYWNDRLGIPDGLAYIGENRIELSPWTCQMLARKTDPMAGVAASIVVHEAVHIALASRDEALVECVAGENYWPAIKALGLAHKVAAKAYKAALQSHENLANDPTGTYAWKGHC